MSKKKNTLADYEELLRQQEVRLIDLKSEAWIFLDAEHTLADVKKVQSKVHLAELEVGAINRNLLKQKKLWVEHKAGAESLRKACLELFNYTKDMSKALSDDYADLKRTADSERFDSLKEIGTFLAIVGAAIGYAKARNSSSITVDEAAAAGALIAFPITARKKLPTTFKSVAKMVCDTPREIKDSFMVYYLKENAKEHGREAVKLLRRSVGIKTPVS